MEHVNAGAYLLKLPESFVAVHACLPSISHVKKATPRISAGTCFPHRRGEQVHMDCRLCVCECEWGASLARIWLLQPLEIPTLRTRMRCNYVQTCPYDFYSTYSSLDLPLDALPRELAVLHLGFRVTAWNQTSRQQSYNPPQTCSEVRAGKH
jgi:hypothetical protein